MMGGKTGEKRMEGEKCGMEGPAKQKKETAADVFIFIIFFFFFFLV